MLTVTSFDGEIEENLRKSDRFRSVVTKHTAQSLHQDRVTIVSQILLLQSE